MEHLHAFIQKDRNNALKVLGDGQMTVSMKMDGAAMQMSFGGERPVFHKRSGEPTKEGPVIRDVDMYLSNFYYDAMEYLKSKTDSISSFTEYIRLLNFEIFSDKGDMDILINYNSLPKNNICLLGGVTTDGDKPLKKDIIDEIGKSLDVDVCPTLFMGTLGKDKAEKLMSFAEKNKEGKGKDNLRDFVKSLFGTTDNTMLDNTKDGIIEGIVISVIHEGKTYTYKLDDPEFTRRWNDVHGKKDDQRKTNLDDIGDMICDSVENSGYELHKQSDSLLVNLIENFMATVAKDEKTRSAFGGYLDRNKDNLKLNWNSRMVPSEYRDELLNSKDHLGELLCAWVLLLNRRTKKEDSPIRKRLNLLVDKML